jgi:hypothetical protein
VYITLLVGTVGGMVWVLLGLYEALRQRRTVFTSAWLWSLVFFYLFWAGATSRIHNYYNLPALGPVCLLFALGCSRFLGTAPARRHPVAARLAVGLLVLASAVGPTAFLHQQDPVLRESCAWLRQHTAPEDLVLVRINHRTDTSTYQHNSTVSYYAQRRIWCWVPGMPEEQRQRALQTARWALVTHPPKAVGVIERLRRWVKLMILPVEDMRWLEQKGFTPHYEGNGFTIYRRKPPVPAAP